MIVNSNMILNDLQDKLILKYDGIAVKNKKDLNLDHIVKVNPKYIFFMHWSWIIPEEIFSKYICIVFHMTDLPYGRGGSPLQNLIINGHKETKLSALKVEKGLDTGEIYLKKDLSLLGKASEIFLRAGEVIGEMIDEIINTQIFPKPQIGTAVVFSRRTPEQSLISDEINNIEKLYDFIRMLDAENYPNAFLENATFKLKFTEAEIINENELKAHVRIIKK